MRLEQLTPPIVQRWLTARKKAHGARRRIELAHATLRSALTKARRLQLVSLNAAELVTVPKPACGLRLGEAVGLRWTDVDLTTGVLQVRQQLQLVKIAGEKYRRLLPQ